MRDKSKMKKEIEKLLLEGSDSSKIRYLLKEIDELKERLDIEEEEKSETESLHTQEMQMIEEEKAELASELESLKKKLLEEKNKAGEDIDQLEEERDKLLRELKELRASGVPPASPSPTVPKKEDDTLGLYLIYY